MPTAKEGMTKKRLFLMVLIPGVIGLLGFSAVALFRGLDDRWGHLAAGMCIVILVGQAINLTRVGLAPEDVIRNPKPRSPRHLTRSPARLALAVLLIASAVTAMAVIILLAR